MRTLLFTQCFLQTEERARLLAVNLELMQRLNPDFHILLIDNASPLWPQNFSPHSWVGTAYDFEAFNIFPPLESSFSIVRFRESIGHFSHKFVGERDPLTARDGPGRGIMTALRIAMNSGYDRAVSMEDDALFCRPLEEGFAQMTKPVACLPRGKFGYLETNVLWFSDLKWLESYKFIERYDWPNQKQGPGREGERVWEWLLGEHLQVLPFRGGRGEGFMNERNLDAVFPNGVDWLTHVSRETYAELLRIHGHDDLAEKL